MPRILLAIAVLAIAPGITRPCLAAPIQIEYLATDLPDTVPGEDRWAYQYFVSGFTFEADHGFSIEFDASLFADLQDPPPPVHPDWDVVVFQPDAALDSPGLYDALALTDGASLDDPFVVAFTWLGGTPAPGSQPFAVNAFDASGLLTVLETGTTVPLVQTVPEPVTALLLAMGAAGTRWRYRRVYTAGGR
jgi:hypothetical protein